MNLLLILIVFSISFLTRWIGDTFFVQNIIDGHNENFCESESGRIYVCEPYALSLYIETTQYIYDLIPIAAILLFHHFNFREDRPRQGSYRSIVVPSLYDEGQSVFNDTSTHARLSDLLGNTSEITFHTHSRATRHYKKCGARLD